MCLTIIRRPLVGHEGVWGHPWSGRLAPLPPAGAQLPRLTTPYHALPALTSPYHALPGFDVVAYKSS